MIHRLPRINTAGCNNEIDPNIPYWTAFGVVLCDKCGAPMLHHRNMGVYIMAGIDTKQICGEYNRFAYVNKPKKIYANNNETY